MVATLARSGSTFITGNLRSFDAWGGIRLGPQSGSPKGRYCANLGHVQDDESGLIYMRARYYEPGTGRFISQDPHKNGFNWFDYANNQANCFVDKTGRDTLADEQALMALFDAGPAGTFFMLALNAIIPLVKIDIWDYNHPDQFDAGHQCVDMFLIVLVAVMGAVVLGAMVATMTAGLAVIAVIACFAAAAMLAAVLFATQDALSNDAMTPVTGGDG